MGQKVTLPKSVSRCAVCGKPLRHITLRVTVVLCMECYDERRYQKGSARMVQSESLDQSA